GDFRQVLPVVPHGSRQLTVFKNIRVNQNEIEFSKFLLQIGNGEYPLINPDSDKYSIEIKPSLLSKNIIKDVTGQGTGQRILLPGIDLTPSNSTLPFSFTRRQFPIKTAFAMKINKAQVKHWIKYHCIYHNLCLAMVNFMLPCLELDHILKN
ncbi:ATP-dependent DNA helicase, partial [Aphis craccivora]